MLNLDPGIYTDVSHGDYHADRVCAVPTLSSSIARMLVGKSPLHAWSAHPRLGGSPPPPASEAMDRGSILDALLFGIGPELVPVDAKDFRTDKAKAERAAAEARGAIAVIASRLTAFEETAKIMRQRIADAGTLAGVDLTLTGVSQATAIWGVNGVRCRARLDHLKVEQSLILDLKTCWDASPTGADRSMNSQSAGVQNAAYRQAIETIHPELAGRMRMLFIYAEPDPPYDVTINQCAGSMRELGERQWNRAVETWGSCLKRNIWRGYPKEILNVEAKPWLLTDDIEKQADNMGNDNAKSPF